MGDVIPFRRRATGSWQSDMTPANHDEIAALDYLPEVDHTHEYDEAFLRSIGMSTAPSPAVPPPCAASACGTEPTHSPEVPAIPDAGESRHVATIESGNVPLGE